ncbi:MAG: class I SAM-dependent methyltransferase [Candidatus Dormibacteria bacterium]
MDHADHVRLIRGGVGPSGGNWADLGAGRGAFTLALAELLGAGGSITAVDRDRRALRELSESMAARFPSTELEVVAGDFTRDHGIDDLDGVVMANSLHFLRDKALGADRLRRRLRPDPRARLGAEPVPRQYLRRRECSQLARDLVRALTGARLIDEYRFMLLIYHPRSDA